MNYNNSINQNYKKYKNLVLTEIDCERKYIDCLKKAYECEENSYRSILASLFETHDCLKEQKKCIVTYTKQLKYIDESLQKSISKTHYIIIL